YGEAGDHLGRRTDGVPVDGSGAVELVLEPAVTLRGRLVDVDARPVTGVEIQVHADLSRNHLLEPPLSVAARSDGDGRFTLPRLPEAPIYELITRASGFAASVFAVTRPEGGGPLELVLRRGRQVVGDIVDAAGQPITNAAAMLYPSRRADRGRLLVDDVHVGVSGGEGIFSMDHVLAGRYELGVSADGFAPLKVPDLEILDGDGALDLGTIDLEAESTLGGRVVDVDDRPLAGASISYLALAYEVGPDDDQLSTMKTTGTDGDGRFMIRQLASDQLLDLKVRRTGYRERRLVGVEASGGEPLVVTLDPVAQIFGRVVDEEGSPVPSAHLVVDPLEDFDAGVTAAIGGEPRTTTADGRGHFTLTAPEPGAYRIRASADTYLPSRDHTFEVRDDLSAEPLTLVVREGARIAGRVLDVEGRPVAGARVRVVEPAPRRAEAAAEGRSRSDGSYELDGLEVGPTRFEVVHGDFPRAFRTLELHGALHRLDVTLDPGAELRGRVVGETRSPIAGALLRLEVVDGPRQPRKSAQSDTDGSFRLRGVPVGSYRLRATKEGLAEAAVTVQVDSLGALGGPLELEMRGGGVVIGQVYGLVGSEWDRLTVAARRPGHREVPGSVDFEGAFRVEHLAAGEWSLEASLRGEPGRRASSPLRIEAAAPEVYRDLDFESGLIVAGDVRRDCGPVAGALVALVREDLSTSGGARSGLDGRFVLTGVEPGRYDLNVKDPETGYFHRRTLEVEADRELVVELELGQATIDGPVEQASGGPAPSGGAP
ncbi:MAG: carboxypeptidase-like regulatory domain-containing protein, partial [Acidobacteriota bacterium]